MSFPGDASSMVQTIFGFGSVGDDATARKSDDALFHNSDDPAMQAVKDYHDKHRAQTIAEDEKAHQYDYLGPFAGIGQLFGGLFDDDAAPAAAPAGPAHVTLKEDAPAADAPMAPWQNPIKAAERAKQDEEIRQQQARDAQLAPRRRPAPTSGAGTKRPSARA